MYEPSCQLNATFCNTVALSELLTVTEGFLSSLKDEHKHKLDDIKYETVSDGQ